MKKLTTRWNALLAAGLCMLASLSASAADLTANYSWKPLKIGGGGWVVGMWVSPTTANLMYCRTDVSGAYRWDSTTSTWKQLLTSTGMPASYVSYGTYTGVDSIVGAPNASNIAYMAFQGQGFASQIFKSTNQGDTWNATTFNSKGVTMGANGDGRQEGERLQVDPNNSSVVYYGPINDQPYYTTDSGTTWTKLTAVPAGTSNHGCNTIKFYGGSGTTGGKTNVIYISVDNNGVWRSGDAGATWTNIGAASGGPGTAMSSRDAAVGPDGSYYVVYTNEEGHAGQVWKYSTAGTWTNITPNGTQSYVGIAVDPTNGNRLSIIQQGGGTYTSTNQGSTYTTQSWNLTSSTVTWLGAQTNYWLSIGQIHYDPFDSGRLWFAEGFGVWTTKDIADTVITWVEKSAGIEEVCGNAIIAPAGGVPYTAGWDVGGFRYTNPDTYSATRKRPVFMAGWDLDWCQSTPSFLVGVFHDTLDYFTPTDETGYSNDGGATWTSFPAVANGTKPAALKYGVIAVASANTSNIVWCPANNGLPYYTTNQGSTWTQASFGGATTTGYGNSTDPWAFVAAMKPLCADRATSGTFYFYSSSDGIYRTTNGGANWSRMGNNPVNGRPNAQLKAAPGNAGHLWFVEGSQVPAVGGVWRSTDGGATWSSVAGINRAYAIGFGAAKPSGSGYPAVIVAGQVSGVDGIFISADAGATWDKICGYPLGIYDWIDQLDGDKTTYGKVYATFAQTGNVYGVMTSLPDTTFSNGSFETPALAAGAYQYNPTGGTWSFTGQCGIQRGSTAWGAPTPPDGSQTSIIQVKTPGTNGNIAQTFTVNTAGSYNITLQAATRTGYPTMTFNVVVDGTTVGAFTPMSSTSFTPFTTSSFALTTGSHTVALIGQGSLADSAVFVDAVGLNKQPAALTVPNASFETPALAANGWGYNPTGGSWTFAGQSGLERNSTAWGAPASPDGSQAAMIQVHSGFTNGNVSQAITFDTAGSYTISCKAALRGGYSAISFSVTVDGTTVGTFSPTTTTSFTSYTTAPFSVGSAGSHTISFNGLGSVADGAIFLDAVTAQHN